MVYDVLSGYFYTCQCLNIGVRSILFFFLSFKKQTKNTTSTCSLKIAV